jgi:hypothetical protein
MVIRSTAALFPVLVQGFLLHRMLVLNAVV